MISASHLQNINLAAGFFSSGELSVDPAFPLWFMATSAFKAEPEIQAIPIHWLPHDFQWLAQFKLAGDRAQDQDSDDDHRQ